MYSIMQYNYRIVFSVSYLKLKLYFSPLNIPFEVKVLLELKALHILNCNVHSDGKERI